MVDYGHFGDVVSFDTTYRKNKDGRPFSMVVGVNHHKQTVIFGAALLYDETASTFMWLFDTFARAMSGKKPITILTDQDAAMAKALVSKWPDTCHRLCIWHIYQNATMHLSNVFARFATLSKDFTSCIYEYEEEDFLNAWKEMLRKYGLETNEWLERIFKLKEKWALVYGRQYFCADLTTTQRSESINGVLKRYVSYKNNMLQFFQHFDRLVVDRRYAELQANLRSSQSTPVLSFPVEILKHAATIYTHEVFVLFQGELQKAYDAKIELSSEVGETFEYKITPFRKHRQHTVKYNSSEVKVSCSCKKFEFAGILCSHALKVLSLRNIIRIPDFYIRKRWTKSAKKSVVADQALGVGTEHSMDEKEEKKMIGVRSKELCSLSYQLGATASMTTETFKITKMGLLKMIEEIDTTLENGTDTRPTIGSKFIAQNNASADAEKKSNEIVVRGWKKKEANVVKSAKRPKSGLEMSIRKKRKMHINMSLSNDTSVNEENNEQNVNSGQNRSRADASFDRSPYSSLSQLSQDYQAYRSNSSVAYHIERFPMSHMQSFPVAQTFNPANHQPLNLSQYSRQDEQNTMSLTGLLQQQLVNAQGAERLPWNNSTNKSQHENINEGRGDISKG